MEAARLAGGSLTRAESYLGEEGKHLRELAESFLEAVHTDHVLGRLAWAAQAASDKNLVPELLDLVGVYTRDLFARRSGLPEQSFLLSQAPQHGWRSFARSPGVDTRFAGPGTDSIGAQCGPALDHGSTCPGGTG